MTQLDFFDMQEEPERAWEENKRKLEAQRSSGEAQRSAAQVATEAPRNEQSAYSAAAASSTEIFDISDECEQNTRDENQDNN